MTNSRRAFLQRTMCGALGAAAFTSGLQRFGLVNALAQSQTSAATDYRALVCIFLFGGNDGNNMIVPYDGYQDYARVRGVAGTSGSIAIAQSDLLQIAPPSRQGIKYGMHPNLPEMQDLFLQRKLAVMTNVGTLIQPLTRAQFQTASTRPRNLFSHSDQQAQWQTSISETPSATGWAGRTADRTRTLNGAATFPMIVSVAGASLFTNGVQTFPIALTPNQSFGLQGYTQKGTDPNVAARYNAVQQLLTSDRDATLVDSASNLTSQAVGNSDLLNTALASAATLQTTFPNTGIGNELKQIAKIIAARNSLGLKRQIFFCSLGGFDTHNNELATHVTLYTQLSQAMKAFYNSTVELGVASNVTTFTQSDFGRTFKPAAGGGSDHAWGSHHLVMGDAVRGGDFYGSYPTLALAGPDDSGSEGRWIPTSSVDQYAATLASWYGLNSADLPAVFPYIGRFATTNLGFMG
ncbi:MAG: DUF1501 domain-containing protein [Pyrinomonadaceae bacterium]